MGKDRGVIWRSQRQSSTPSLATKLLLLLCSCLCMRHLSPFSQLPQPEAQITFDASLPHHIPPPILNSPVLSSPRYVPDSSCSLIPVAIAFPFLVLLHPFFQSSPVAALFKVFSPLPIALTKWKPNPTQILYLALNYLPPAYNHHLISCLLACTSAHKPLVFVQVLDMPQLFLASDPLHMPLPLSGVSLQSWLNLVSLRSCLFLSS